MYKHYSIHLLMLGGGSSSTVMVSFDPFNGCYIQIFGYWDVYLEDHHMTRK